MIKLFLKMKINQDLAVHQIDFHNQKVNFKDQVIFIKIKDNTIIKINSNIYMICVKMIKNMDSRVELKKDYIKIYIQMLGQAQDFIKILKLTLLMKCKKK